MNFYSRCAGYGLAVRYIVYHSGFGGNGNIIADGYMSDDPYLSAEYAVMSQCGRAGDADLCHKKATYPIKSKSQVASVPSLRRETSILKRRLDLFSSIMGLLELLF